MTRRWVKVCGMTSAAGVAAALEAGADAIGFVFAESVRKVDVDTALALAAPARGRAAIVAVMRHPEPAAAAAIVARFAPDWLQTDAGDFAALALPPGVAALPVYRDSAPPDPGRLPARLLYESDHSGSGATADWTRAKALAGQTWLTLAGGLNPGNVGPAIENVAPAGVDVSSGVESRPGIKDPDLIHAFVAAARRA